MYRVEKDGSWNDDWLDNTKTDMTALEVPRGTV
jgi:hypothetical protein